MAPKEGIAPIYNATNTLFRLSPLYVPDAKQFWTESNLNFHAKRFADSIQNENENFRTVNAIVEEADDALNKAGPFKRCVWSQLKHSAENEEDTNTADDLGLLEGLQVEVEYERAKYTALLLTGVNSLTEDDDEKLKLPLVCIRMPAALRSSFSYYMATIFDTRMEPLQLSSTTICKSLENFLDEIVRDEDNIQRIVKEIQLTMAFQKPILPSLKAIDVAIKREDILGFIKQGQAINATSVSSVKSVQSNFMTALQKYLSAHLALDINADQIIISRVACGAFALGREGKAKLFVPQSKTDDNGNFDVASMASRRATGQILQILLRAAIGNT